MMFNEVNNLAKITNKVRYFVSVADTRRQVRFFTCRFFFFNDITCWYTAEYTKHFILVFCSITCADFICVLTLNRWITTKIPINLPQKHQTNCHKNTKRVVFNSRKNTTDSFTDSIIAFSFAKKMSPFLTEQRHHFFSTIYIINLLKNWCRRFSRMGDTINKIYSFRVLNSKGRSRHDPTNCLRCLPYHLP